MYVKYRMLTTVQVIRNHQDVVTVVLQDRVSQNVNYLLPFRVFLST